MKIAISDLVAELLKRPVAFHRIYAQLCGSATAGLMLSQAVYWTDNVHENEPARDGWFFKRQSEWFDEICLTRCEQETARKILRRFDFWREERRGAPAKLWFKVDREALVLSIVQFAENQQSRMRKTAAKSAENQQSHLYTENTSERKPGALNAPRFSPSDPTKELKDRRKVEARDRRERIEAAIGAKAAEARIEANAGAGPAVPPQRPCAICGYTKLFHDLKLVNQRRHDPKWEPHEFVAEASEVAAA